MRSARTRARTRRRGLAGGGRRRDRSGDRRAVALAAVALAAVLVPAGAAQAFGSGVASLSVDGASFRYDGAAAHDSVLVQTMALGGQFQLDLVSTQAMTRVGGAVSRCPIDGMMIRCDATGLSRVEVALGGGMDAVHMAPPRDGVAALPLTAFGEGGDDRLIADPVDVHSGCERFGSAPPEPEPVPAQPQPQPPAQEPAPPHSELPAPDPTITVRLARGRGGSRVKELVVRAVPERSTVTLTCSSPRRGACPFRRVRSHHRHGADRLDLRPRLRSRRLPPRTVLTVRVSDRIGDLAVGRVTVRR